MAKRKRIFFIGGITLIILMVAFSIIMRNREKLPEAETVHVILEDFKREVSANGEIGSRESSAVYSTVSAEIESIPVRRGDLIEERGRSGFPEQGEPGKQSHQH